MRTVFLGTSEFAAAVLEHLARGDQAAAHRPALVVTRPDRPAGRGRALSAPPVALRARELGIELIQPVSVNDPTARERIAAVAPTVVIVCAFGALIKEPLLSDYELLNVHPSLLPRWRGAAPVERAIMAGDERTGVSIMRVTAGLDSGPVCAVRELSIEREDTYGTLSERLRSLGSDLLVAALDELEAGETLSFVEQDEDGVTYAEKIGPADRLLDANRPAIELERTVRALSPHIGARLQVTGGATLGVWRVALAPDTGAHPPLPASTDAHVVHAAGALPGRTLYASGERLLLACSPGTLELLEVQPPGKRPMPASAYLRGHGVPPAVA